MNASKVYPLKFPDGSLEIIDSFYLSDANWRRMDALKYIVAGLKNFRNLLLWLETMFFSFKVKGRLFCTCIRTSTLHNSETWVLNLGDFKNLEKNETSIFKDIPFIHHLKNGSILLL